MSRAYFIVALILIGETLFRLFPYPSGQYDFFPFSDVMLHTDTYLYFLFEHLKVLGLVYILYIVETRCAFLVWVFLVDLAIYLLNYNSTLFYWGWLPIGADTIKLTIFGIVIIREALAYYYGNHPDSHERRSSYAYAHGHVPAALWVKSLSRILLGRRSIGKDKKNP